MKMMEEIPSVFTLIKNGDFDTVEELIMDNDINVNEVDGVGNDVVTRLLKAKQYELVIEVMKKRNWDVNHQNDDGNTFGHILACDDSVMAVKVMEALTKKKNYMPNIKNYSLKEVLALCELLDIDVVVDGNGYVKSYSIKEGTVINKDMTLEVKLEPLYKEN